MVRQHVSLEELQAFVLDGDPLSFEARQHFDGCPDCQIQVARIHLTTGALLSHLYRSQCPSALTLSFYCLPDALCEEEQRKVARHLAHCPHCLAELGETRQFLNLSSR